MILVAMKNLLKKTPVIPVITINHIDHVLPLAKALVSGGISLLEITLRTPIALEAIKLLKKKLPECTVGAGTITTTEQLLEVQSAGASFAVSPALSVDLIYAAKTINMPYLPGVCTPSEVLLAKQHGLGLLKFYPANVAGGVRMLRHFYSIFPTIKFCPTGGINQDNFNDYLTLPNVISVGGSWLASQDLIEKNKWDIINDSAKAVSNHTVLEKVHS